jgi:hypothetical protein
LSHWFRRFCYICGDPATGGDGTHCRRHTAYTNQPAKVAQKYCCWCAQPQHADAAEECQSCNEEEHRVSVKMTRLADELNSRPAVRTPEWSWCNCPHCGLYTVCVRAKPGLLQSLLGSYGARYLECGNCIQV